MRHVAVVTGLLLFIAAGAAMGLHTQQASANNIAPFETVFNTNYVSAGYGGMRGIGTGSIHLTGVSGTVTKALLFWHGPTDSTDPNVNAAVSFNGTAIQGTNIGISSDNCWGFDNSQAYRADVTSLVAGNGDYALSNFTKADADINGVSLLVFFDNGNPAGKRDIVLFDGNDSNTHNTYDADGWNVSLPGINYTSGTASMELHVSDGQSFEDDALVLNGSQLVPAGAVFQGDSVPNGPAAEQDGGGLWDIKDYDVTSFLSPGTNTLTLTTNYVDDCLSLIVAAVNLPAGAAPGQPTPTVTGIAQATSTATATATRTIPSPTATATVACGTSVDEVETPTCTPTTVSSVRVSTATPTSTATARATLTATAAPPTSTSTPASTVLAAAATPRTGVVAPNTGSGPSRPGSRATGWFALTAALLLLAGIAVTATGLRERIGK